MATRSLPYIRPEQYLDFDRNLEFKSEYFFGEIVCMAGGTPDHSLISMNVGAAFQKRLAGGHCHVYNSDLRVCLDRQAGYVYPDVTVVCGPREYTDERQDTVANPKLVVEVLSPSTANLDLSVKARLYLRSSTLSDFLFIAQDRVWVEHWQRSADGAWKRSEFDGIDSILEIGSFHCAIPLAEIYSGVENR